MDDIVYLCNRFIETNLHGVEETRAFWLDVQEKLTAVASENIEQRLKCIFYITNTLLKTGVTIDQDTCSAVFALLQDVATLVLSSNDLIHVDHQVSTDVCNVICRFVQEGCNVEAENVNLDLLQNVEQSVKAIQKEATIKNLTQLGQIVCMLGSISHQLPIWSTPWVNVGEAVLDLSTAFWSSIENNFDSTCASLSEMERVILSDFLPFVIRYFQGHYNIDPLKVVSLLTHLTNLVIKGVSKMPAWKEPIMQILRWLVEATRLFKEIVAETPNTTSSNSSIIRCTALEQSNVLDQQLSGVLSLLMSSPTRALWLQVSGIHGNCDVAMNSCRSLYRHNAAVPRTGALRFLILSDPRSGSTLLASYLMCHPRILMHGEMLNDEMKSLPDSWQALLEHLDDELTSCSLGCVEGLKIHLEQLVKRDLEPLQLVRRLNISFVLLMWRRSLLDSFVSLKIALDTGCWYTETKTVLPPNVTKTKLYVDEVEFACFCDTVRAQWKSLIETIGAQISVIPIEYSSLVKQPDETLMPVFRAFGLKRVPVSTAMVKQNESDPSVKIANWHMLSETSKNAQLDIDVLLDEVRARERFKSQPWWPEHEPMPRTGLWVYRVAEPFLPSDALSNVFKAVALRSVSSAASPITEMACELRRFYNVPVAQPCANGFVSLLLSLQCARIGPNDYVLVPAFTMIAVPNAVLYVGATPVFVDNTPDKYNPGVAEYEAAAQRISKGSIKAVIVAHTYSVPADIEQLRDMCLQHNWLLIEDISECIGVSVKGKLLGTFGTYACASLYANKTITAGDGGFVISLDPTAAIRLTSIVNHGFTPRYHFVHHEPCINAKINGLGAALVTPAIRRIREVIEHRTRMAHWYREGLASVSDHVKCMPLAGDGDAPWVFGIECHSRNERDRLRNYLACEHGIETRNYFLPLNLQSAFDDLPEFTRVPCPHTLRLAEVGFYLPSHFWLRLIDVANICQAVTAFYSNTCWTMPERTISTLPVAAMVNTRTGRLEAYGGESVQDQQVLINAVHTLQAVHNFFSTQRECWSQCKELEEWLSRLSREEQLESELRSCFVFYAHYLNAMRSHNHILPVPTFRSPWLDFNLVDDTGIPTTTPFEVQQLLCWLAVTHDCHSIVELGPWLGGTTVQILHALRRQNSQKSVHYVALDGFLWQQWMNTRGNSWQHRAPRRPFLADFQANVAKVSENSDFNPTVVSVQLSYDTNTWSTLTNVFTQPIDLIYVDISDDEDELERLWNALRYQLIPNKTIVVIHTYYAVGVCKFVERHLTDFKPLHKPAEFVKVFVYVGTSVLSESGKTSLPKKVKFTSSPSDWDHHRGGGFCAIIDYAREHLHDDRASTHFIPAVEQYFFEHDLRLEEPWMGIMHQVPISNTLWIPDIDRLLHSPQFLYSLTYCRGLFTLSSYLRDYIRERLPMSLSKTIPVCRLYYPLSAKISVSKPAHPRTSLVMIGGYMRNMEDFLQLSIPANFEKVLLLSEKEGVDEHRFRALASQANIKVLDRLTDDEYEQMLEKSIPFLSLLSDGVASTLILECIWSHTPLVVRRFASLEEYLGRDYPLFFDSIDEVNDLLIDSNNNVQLAATYLANMDKSHLTREAFVKAIGTSASYAALPVSTIHSDDVDLTVCICSYQRTDDLVSVLRALLYEQDYDGTFEVILWNNNFDRRVEVERICSLFDKPIRLIHSSENYYCIIRLCMLHLMNSEWLLIVDDDMIPGPRFLSTFVEQRRVFGPQAILCLHGHKFLPHSLNAENPADGWTHGRHVQFINDQDPPDRIHFAHADGCLFPRQALRDAATIKMTEKEFVLVDDYWLSFVLSHYFGYHLCKITSSGIYTKTASADDASVALYLNPKVRDARLKLYVHHMLRGWPSFASIIPCAMLRLLPTVTMRTIKTSAWQQPFVGFNVPMGLQVSDMRELQRLNVRVVRLGAVCATLDDDSTENNISDLAFLMPQYMGQILPEALQRLVSYIDMFGKHNIQVVLTLHRHLASPNVWQQVSAVLGKLTNVVGYDLINEPCSLLDRQMSIDDLDTCAQSTVNNLLAYYSQILDAIRQEDAHTPVIIEAPYWAHWKALHTLNIGKSILASHARDVDLFKISFHMYEPRQLTSHRLNKGRYEYPGRVPTYGGPCSPIHEWNSLRLAQIFNEIEQIVSQVLELSSQQVFIGEVGISRKVPGAAVYLKDVLEECRKHKWSTCLYAFREFHWNTMDYELGVEPENECMRTTTNPLMLTITKAIQKMTEI